MTLGRCALALAAVVAAIFVPAAAKADDFYKGKTIRLIVGSSEGSGVDILARIAARHLGNHIPGKPNIIAQNMAAPESIAGANYIFNIAAPDGLTIGTGSSGLLSRAISQPNIRFDLGKFTWIANLYSATVLFWMRTDFPCQTFAALARCPQTLKFGATARGSTGYGLVPELVKDAFGLNMDLIYGYRSSAINVAVERGEIHASGGDLIGFMGGRPRQLMQEGKVKILLQVAGDRDPELDKLKVPWVMDVVPATHKKLFMMVNPIIDLARPYFAPPNVPPERAKILQAAFASLAKDPAFRAETKRVARIEPTHLPGPKMDAAIKQILTQPKEVKDKVIGLLKGK
ncbi:MAG: Bug family tripartite tricarboxylate transporter substrate binding protein [Xanthobacteraceae bacterium]